MSGLVLALRQARFENKAFWRNPPSVFFTFAFPLLFLVIFTTILGGGDRTQAPGGDEISTATYFVGSILAFAIITASFTNLAIRMTFARDQGILKRVRGTPLPPWSYLVGVVLQSVFVQAILVVIVLAFGLAFYDVELPTSTALPFIVTLAIGSASFCTLGLAATALVPNAEAAPAVVNALVLPLLFISGTFFPTTDAPQWLNTVADVFPVKHFTEAMLTSFLGANGGYESGWRGMDLLIIAIWGVVALFLAIRFFTWEPRR